jgi:hypothetical protein
LLRILQQHGVKMTIPTKQHGLIPVTKYLRSNANTYAIPQHRCCDPMSDVMHPQIWTPQHAGQAAPLLSIVPADRDLTSLWG